MSKGFFITGTDTGVGKTWFTISLMQALKNHGYDTVGMKPIASGATNINGKLVNDDARAIISHCSKPVAYELVNPFVFELPIAPHIAAIKEQKNIAIDPIINCFKQLIAYGDMIVVEGVGGWQLPLSENVFLAELVRALYLPVIMVVGIKLGCINHALLTANAVQSDGAFLCGWVSCHVEEETYYREELIAELEQRLNCLHVADLHYSKHCEVEKMAKKIKLPSLLSVV